MRIELRLATLSVCVLLGVGMDSTCWAVDFVTLDANGRSSTLVGKVLVTAQDGGMLLMDRDGVLWIVQPEELNHHETTDDPFLATDPLAYARRLQLELPDGFQMRQTAHYVFLYDTSPAYAKWCGVLYERLYRAFHNFWQQRGITLHEPSVPLVAIIFADPHDFRAYGEQEMGEAVRSVVGYYNMQTNRVVMCDLTGLERQRRANGTTNHNGSLQQILAQPSSLPNIATIVHEATHQLAYNTGLQTRYADNPLWLSEGLAIFFETPDHGNEQGWRKVGGLHPQRLLTFRRSLAGRQTTRLVDLITDDGLLRDPATAGEAYAESWALCYYLLRRNPDGLVAYLQELSELSPLATLTIQERREMFEKHFGDLVKLDRDFVRYMSTVK